MEKWETEYRARLDKVLIDGAYQVGGKERIHLTGKQGFINYLVELERKKKCSKSIKEHTIEGDINYSILDISKIREIFKYINPKENGN